MTPRPPRKQNRGEVSVRGSTFEKLRAYCRKHGVQMRSVVDELLIKALDAESKKEN